MGHCVPSDPSISRMAHALHCRGSHSAAPYNCLHSGAAPCDHLAEREFLLHLQQCEGSIHMVAFFPWWSAVERHWPFVSSAVADRFFSGGNASMLKSMQQQHVRTDSDYPVYRRAFNTAMIGELAEAILQALIQLVNTGCRLVIHCNCLHGVCPLNR